MDPDATLTGLSPLEQRVVDAVDADALVETARTLVQIPTWNGRETPAQETMAGLMADVGLDVDLWEIDLDELARHPHYAAEIPRDRALGLVGTLPGSGEGPSLILNGHVDVVPPGDPALWTVPAFEGVVRDGRFYGRGALDMKGPLAAGLHALRALEEAGACLKGSVHLQSVIGEEDGGSGTLATVLRGYRADGAVVMEPTGLALAPALAGVINFRVRVPGLAAHGAVREEGVSALEKLFPVLQAIQRLEEVRNARMGSDPVFDRYRLPFPICVGTVRGGDWASSVPDHVTVEGRMGLAPDEAPEEARREMTAALERVSSADAWLREHPPVLEWWGGRFLGARTPDGDPIIGSVAGAAEAVTGRLPDLEGMTYGADMGILAGVGGTPAVLYGPGDIRLAHRPDEWVAVDDLVTTARVLAVAALRFCGYGAD